MQVGFNKLTKKKKIYVEIINIAQLLAPRFIMVHLPNFIINIIRRPGKKHEHS